MGRWAADALQTRVEARERLAVILEDFVSQEYLRNVLEGGKRTPECKGASYITQVEEQQFACDTEQTDTREELRSRAFSLDFATTRRSP